MRQLVASVKLIVLNACKLVQSELSETVQNQGGQKHYQTMQATSRVVSVTVAYS